MHEKQYKIHRELDFQNRNSMFVFYIPQILQPCLTVFSDGEIQSEIRFINLKNKNKVAPYNFDKGRIVQIIKRESEEEKTIPYLKNETAEFIILTKLGSVEHLVISQL